MYIPSLSSTRKKYKKRCTQPNIIRVDVPDWLNCLRPDWPCVTTWLDVFVFAVEDLDQYEETDRPSVKYTRASYLQICHQQTLKAKRIDQLDRINKDPESSMRTTTAMLMKRFLFGFILSNCSSRSFSELRLTRSPCWSCLEGKKNMTRPHQILVVQYLFESRVLFSLSHANLILIVGRRLRRPGPAVAQTCTKVDWLVD